MITMLIFKEIEKIYKTAHWTIFLIGAFFFISQASYRQLTVQKNDNLNGTFF